MIEDSDGEHCAQNAMRHIVDARLWNLPGSYGVFQLRAEEEIFWLLLIESVERCFDRTVRSIPIGHDKSGQSPIALQDRVEHVRVLTSPTAVDEVVRAHDRLD